MSGWSCTTADIPPFGDRSGAETERKIVRNMSLQVRFFTKIQTMTKYIVAMLFWGVIHIVCHKSDYSAVQLAKAPGGYLFWLYI
jgi:hypothetical protein